MSITIDHTTAGRASAPDHRKRIHGMPCRHAGALSAYWHRLPAGRSGAVSAGRSPSCPAAASARRRRIDAGAGPARSRQAVLAALSERACVPVVVELVWCSGHADSRQAVSVQALRNTRVEVIAHGRNSPSPARHSVAPGPGGADVRRIRRGGCRRLPHAGGRRRDRARADARPDRGRRLPRQGRAASIGPGYAAFKVNGNLPDNRAKHGLPTIQGAILLFDAATGSPVALIDSIEITLQRTGAATAVAARHLARPDSQVATIYGCGAQGRIQLAALRHVLDIRRVFLIDRDAAAAERFAGEIAGLDVDVPAVPREVARASDVIVTCTSSNAPFLGPDDVRPGTFVAAIGADNLDKSEIDPALMARARVVTDLTEQCRHMGDLHHSLAAGTMRVADVHAELANSSPDARAAARRRTRSRCSTAPASASRTSPPRRVPISWRATAMPAAASASDEFCMATSQGEAS